MHRLTLASLMSTLALVWVGWAAGGTPESAPVVPGGPSEVLPSERAGYRFTDLLLLRETMKYVQEGYVDPARLDPDRMFTAALEEVEGLVPSVLFRRERGQLNVRIGAFRGVLPSPAVGRADDLADALTPVAELLQVHLEAEDIPASDARLDPHATLEIALVNGALSTLDPHSMLLPPDAAREMDAENRGETGGLGVSLEMDDGRMVVEYVMPGSPAARGGLRDGDIIRRIDGQPAVNLPLDEAVELLRGPVGLGLRLEIEHGAARVELRVERENISLAPVEIFGLADGVGYARIRSFHSTVASELSDGLMALVRADGGWRGLRGVVLDLRDDPGGYLNQAIAVADLFLAEGDIVSTVGPRDQRPRVEQASGPGQLDKVPLVVLIDANSASASEIVAGALRNHERAVIVGERSFGKGSVQNLHPMPFDTRLKLTVAQYLTPGDRSLQSVGVPADVEVLPAVIGTSGPRHDRVVGLFARERVEREADLDAHLEASQAQWASGGWSLKYPRAPDWRDRRPYEAPDAGGDPELQVALSLLFAAPSPRRPEMLEAAGRVVERAAQAADAAVTAAMSRLGVDWRDGEDPVAPQVRVELVTEGPLAAGRRSSVTAALHNLGGAPLSRALMVVDGHDLFDGVEVPFGRVAAGATATVEVPVFVPQGYPDEHALARLSLRGADGAVIASSRAPIETSAAPQPRLAWSWRIEEPTDGRIEVGDTVELVLEVQNLGEGSATAATARLRNGAGAAVDLVVPTLEIGGAPPAEGCEGRCRASLPSGATWTGRLMVEVLAPLEHGYDLSLVLSDEQAWDWGAVSRGGRSELYEHVEAVRFDLGAPPPPSGRHEPPRIALERVPPLQAPSELVSLSGRVTDDAGLRQVLVFAGDDKVAYEDARGRTSIPFVADAWLTPGTTTLTVVATDAEGHTSATSRVVWLSDEGLRAELR